MPPGGSDRVVFRNFADARIGPIVLDGAVHSMRKHMHIFESRMQINIIEFCGARLSRCVT